MNKRITELKRMIDEELETLFQEREPQNLYQPMSHLLLAGGKRIRPLLLILSCQAVGGKTDDCFKAAIAIELLHTFTLIHDDMMDHDDTRRGFPTVHKKWDEAIAILAGDGLVMLAFQTLLDTRHPRLLEVVQHVTDGLRILCEGQAMDKAFEKSDHISLDLYEEMIERKTAHLIEVSCEIGAILGHGQLEEISALKHFARSMGLGFQIQDDFLDLFSEEKITGKPLGSDLIEKKKTFLTISFLNEACKRDVDQFHRIWAKEKLTLADIRIVSDLFRKAGVFENVKTKIDTYFLDSLKHLHTIRPGLARDDLEEMLFFIQKRNA